MQWDPERFGSLEQPGDAYSYDIFTQAARVIGPLRGKPAGVRLLVLLVGPAAAQDRATHQAELDAVCEDTRSAKLTGLRTRYVDECVAEA